LHGLYVKEAIERTEGAIALAQRSGQDELKVVVGKGIHSQGHVAKIKPAVEGLMRKYVTSSQ
jgi:DNA-nicking Smr family endonuclease